MDSTLIITVGFVLVIVIGTFVFIIWHYRLQRKKAAQLAAELGTDSLESGKTYEGELNDRKYYYEYYAGSKNNPSYFKISLDCQSTGEFKIVKERRFDRLFKQLGIAVEIQTGDSYFDKTFYIQTDAVEYTRAYLDSAEHREAIKELFALDFNELFYDGERIVIKKSPFSFRDNPDKHFVEATVTELIRLIQHLPDDIYTPMTGRTRAWKQNRAIIYTISIVSTVGGFGLFFGGLQYFTPLDEIDVFLFSLEYSIPAFVIFIFVAIRLLKGRSSSHKHLLFNFLIALVGFPMTGFGTAMVMNGYMDKAEASYYVVKVTGKRISKSRDSTSYYVSLKSWRERGTEEEIKVSHSTYNNVKSGVTRMTIGTKPGYLGFEWLDSYEIN